ncbi:hypothetical protein Tco_0440300, partial [Tanacetum coccineum]
APAACLKVQNEQTSSPGFSETDPCHLGAGREIKEVGKEMCSIGWGIEEEVCLHTHKAATRVPVHRERNRSQKAKTVKGDIRSQSRENRSQALKRGLISSDYTLKYI